MQYSTSRADKDFAVMHNLKSLIKITMKYSVLISVLGVYNALRTSHFLLTFVACVLLLHL